MHFRSFIRYNQNGALDINFNNGMGTGPNGSLSTCAIQQDGKILIGGVHTRYDGTLINRISRINNGTTLDAIDFNATSSNTFIYPNPANQFLFVSSKFNFTEYLIISQDGKIIETNVLNSSFSIPIHHLNNGLYFIKLSGNDTNYFTKFIKE